MQPVALSCGGFIIAGAAGSSTMLERRRAPVEKIGHDDHDDKQGQFCHAQYRPSSETPPPMCLI